NGDDLCRVMISVPDDDSGRSASERIFQSALMDYADNAGIHNDYDNYGGDHGLSRWEQRYGLEGLFGRDFHLLGPGGYVHRDLLDVLRDCMPTPTLADLHWSDGAHAVVVTKIENGRVFYHNPWGPVTDDVQNGDEYPYDNPRGRRLEDRATGLESMSL